MRMNRIFCEGPLASGAELALSPAGAYHVARVCACVKARRSRLFDGGGQEFRARDRPRRGPDVTVRLGESTSGTAESPLRITLLRAYRAANAWTGRCRRRRARRRYYRPLCALRAACPPGREAGAEEAGPLARHRYRGVRAVRRSKVPHVRGAGDIAGTPGHRAQGRPAARAEPSAAGSLAAWQAMPKKWSC